MLPAAIPYCGAPPVPADLLARWNFDVLLILFLAMAFLLFRRLGARLVPLAASATVLLVLFVSPLCALSSALFSARVAHHVLLTAAAAPLLALALPRGGGGHLAAWTLGHAAIFWAWHAPAAYAFALDSDPAYWLMEGSLFVSAVGFWRAVRAAPVPSGVAALLATMMQMGLLGALLTFAGTPIYQWHFTATQVWGLSPLQDQQLSGLIMWVPGAGLYLLAALRLANGWFDERQRLAQA